MSISDFVGVHLVGSTPFDDGEALFAFVGQELCEWLKRVPDETGRRRQWAGILAPYFQTEAFEPVPQPEGHRMPVAPGKLKPGIDPDTIDFGVRVYLEAAKASHKLFTQARERGQVRKDARLQVTIPSPYVVMSFFVAPESVDAVMPAYERQVAKMIAELGETLPKKDLAIQFDIVGEQYLLSKAWTSPVWTPQRLTEGMARIVSYVPEGIELGFHLCFGDTNFAETRGMASPWEPNAVALALSSSAISRQALRPLNFMHMAIPRRWTTPLDFAPLRDIVLHPETALYLGLVHNQDGVEGAHRRIALSRQVIDRPFGIGTECGMGRYGDEKKFRAAIDTVKAVARELAG